MKFSEQPAGSIREAYVNLTPRDKRSSTMVPTEVYEEAKSLGINASRLLTEALLLEIRRLRGGREAQVVIAFADKQDESEAANAK